MHQREWTHCHRGHKFHSNNTYITKDGRRQCKTCRSETQKLYKKRNRGITAKDIPAILADNRIQRVIAKDYGVCKSTIGRIKRGETWNENQNTTQQG